MNLARPWLLLLLPVLVALAGWAARRRPPTLRIASLLDLGEAAAPPRPPVVPILLEAIGAVGLLLAAAGPQRLHTTERQQRPALDILLMLDISGSMGAYDAQPGMDADAVAAAVHEGRLEQRLDVAKRELVRFVQARPEDRLGLLVFSQRPYLACPLTFDHDFLRKRLDDLETGLVPDGTDVAGVLVSGVGHLRDSPSPRRVAVLFTDGDDNMDSPLSPTQATDLATASRVVVHTVGIGGGEAFLRQPGLVRDRFVRVPAELHEPMLRQIAERSGGEYLPARDAERFAAALRRIDRLERVPVEHLVAARATDLSPPFLLASLTFLLSGLVLSRTRWLAIP